MIGFLTALAAAVAYGVASVLQAVASRDAVRVDGLDPRILVKLVRSWRYVLGVTLDGLGFVLSLVAVRALPLFVVQSVVASFLAITAVLGAVFLKMPLTRVDRIALRTVVAGLVLVGSSAEEDSAVTVSQSEQWGLLHHRRAGGLAPRAGSQDWRTARPRSPRACCPATSRSTTRPTP